MFRDDFDGNALNAASWDVYHGIPAVGAGVLNLTASAEDRSEVQTKARFGPGVRFEAEIESTSWAPSSVEDFDTSFGLELFVDNCHYGIHLVGNGHLGILHPSPSQLADCMGPIGDPEFQTYVVVPDWDTLRASSPLRLRLTWRQTGVDLEIVAGAETRTVSYLAPEIPGNGSPPIVSLPMPIRLNVNYNQSYRVRYVDICAL